MSIIDGRVLALIIVIVAILVGLTIARHNAPTRDDWTETETSPYAHTGDHFEEWENELDRPFDHQQDAPEYRDGAA